MPTLSRRWGKRRSLALAVAGLALALVVAASVLTTHSTPARAATVTVPIGEFSIYGFWFCDASHIGNVCTTTIQVGDSVTWQNTTATSHTSTECDSVCGTIPGSPMWDIAIDPYDTTAPLQFNQVGTFNYQCNVHPTQMKGRIVVQAAPLTATITPTPTSTPSPTATLVPTSTSPPPVGGIALDPGAGARALTAPQSSTGAWPLGEIIVGVTAGLLCLGGAAWYKRKA
jgi:hypothetical protein